MKVPKKTLIILGLILLSPYVQFTYNKANGQETTLPTITNFETKPNDVKTSIKNNLLKNSKKTINTNTTNTSYKEKITDRLNLIK